MRPAGTSRPAQTPPCQAAPHRGRRQAQHGLRTVGAERGSGQQECQEPAGVEQAHASVEPDTVVVGARDAPGVHHKQRSVGWGEGQRHAAAACSGSIQLSQPRLLPRRARTCHRRSSACCERGGAGRTSSTGAPPGTPGRLQGTAPAMGWGRGGGSGGAGRPAAAACAGTAGRPAAAACAGHSRPACAPTWCAARLAAVTVPGSDRQTAANMASVPAAARLPEYLQGRGSQGEAGRHLIRCSCGGHGLMHGRHTTAAPAQPPARPAAHLCHAGTPGSGSMGKTVAKKTA